MSAQPGFLDPRVAQELPGLRLAWRAVEFRPGRVPASLRQQLGELARRYTGAVVVAMRSQQVHRAYRTLYRQLGLDPDATPPPAEAAALRRLREGGFRARDLVSAARLVALAETGVPVWALAGGRVRPPLGIALGGVGDPLAGGPKATDAATVVVADQAAGLCELFGEPPAELVPEPHGGAAVLYAIAAPGVPELHVEEALWLAAEALGTAD